MLQTKITSSLEKIFLDEKIENYPTLERITALKGERVCVQYAYIYDNTEEEQRLIYPYRLKPVISGSLAEYATIRNVRHVPVPMPVNPAGMDDNYLRTAPGLFPDILEDLRYDGKVTLTAFALSALWIEIEIPENISAGEHTLTVTLNCENYGTGVNTMTVDVIDAVLPKEDIYFTQWFHCDGLAQYYNVDVWSDKHWEIVENYARVAVKNGMNMILTPVFTPPLDTAVGGERLTTQLVGVTVEAGKYTFDFTLLDKWIEMCDRIGMKYLEISHFFTQWGAAHAPKIMATVDGEYKKIFGWETEATGAEYSAFLRQFVTELIAHLKSSGNDTRCFFHVSDEPGLAHLENYKAAKAIIADLLEDYKIMDALSKIDFYNTGALNNPIPSNNHVHDFIDAKVPGLWTYYCVSQWKDVSNRYQSMPAWRNRSIGMQIYKYNIVGFLHWGYNFYNNQFSDSPINPYLETTCDFAFPAGDAYSVYPGPDGECLESTRQKVFYEALQDIKAMKLCETLYSHDEVVAAIEEVFGKELRFDTCTKDAGTMLAIREKINMMIKEKV